MGTDVEQQLIHHVRFTLFSECFGTPTTTNKGTHSSSIIKTWWKELEKAAKFDSPLHWSGIDNKVVVLNAELIWKIGSFSETERDS